MRSQVLLAGVAAFAASVAAVPHPRNHAHARAHAERRDMVTQMVTQTVTMSPQQAPPQQAQAPPPQQAQAPPPQVTPQNAPVSPNMAFDDTNKVVGGELPGSDFTGGMTPGGFTPGGFTPRVTATGASKVTLGNGKISISHLEQTLGLSTQAAGQYPTAIPANYPQTYGGNGGPLGFDSDPSTTGPPTHPFEVIVNEPSQGGTMDRDYPGTCLLQTNFHRKNASNPEVIWGFALQRTAQDIANKCVFQQDLTQQNGGYGQAIIAGVPANEIGKVITDTLYNPQVNNFNGWGQATPDKTNFAQWGFYTQLVWAKTQQMACDTVDCSSKGGLQGKPEGASDDFTVCNFWPAGNVDGQYAENVGKPGTFPTMQWDDDTWAAVSGN